MLVIRLRRTGSNKRPFFRVVVTDSRAARGQVDDKQFARVEAIINSMTPKERRNHQVINGQRRKRIAKGSGTSVEDVNKLLKQFVQMQKMLKQLGGMAGLARKKGGGLGMMKSMMNR